MSIELIKKIRYILIITIALFIFFGSQRAINKYGEKADIFEAFLMTIVMLTPLYIMGSDWLYKNHIADKGIRINYYVFHTTGVLILFFVLFIIGIAIYNGVTKV